MSDDFMKDYVAVNERIAAFYAKYPEGSIQSFFVSELTNEGRIAVQARAYRHPGDDRPGTGMSWMDIPGKTPFTRGSELENAETSAGGRALAALGFEVKRGIASQEEIAGKSGDGALASSADRKRYGDAAKAKGLTTKDQNRAFVALVLQKTPDDLTTSDFDTLISKLDEPGLVDLAKDVKKAEAVQ